MRKYAYDMNVMAKKHQKLKSANRDDIDYAELTVSEDEFDDEESKRFQEFIKERREKILKGAEDENPYDDDYTKTPRDEHEHAMKEFDELEQKLDEIKPAEERRKEAMLKDKYAKQYEDWSDWRKQNEDDITNNNL